jgi:hypothetical protein
MKIVQLFAAAGLIVASLGAPSAAQAQHRGDRGDWNRDDRDHRGYDGPRGDARRDWNRRDGRDWGRGDDRRRYDGRGGHAVRYDRGRHYGWNQGGGRARCWSEYRYNHRVRVCR